VCGRFPGARAEKGEPGAFVKVPSPRPKQEHNLITVMVRAGEIQNTIAIEISQKHFSGDAGHRCRRDGRRSEASLAIAEQDREFVVFRNDEIDMPIFVHIAGNEGVPAAGYSSGEEGAGL
jgi:hypothetical protein